MSVRRARWRVNSCSWRADQVYRGSARRSGRVCSRVRTDKEAIGVAEGLDTGIGYWLPKIGAGTVHVGLIRLSRNLHASQRLVHLGPARSKCDPRRFFELRIKGLQVQVLPDAPFNTNDLRMRTPVLS